MLEKQSSPVIMIVDDEPVSLKLLRAFLERCGFTMFVATGGEEALVKIKEIRPDIILLDIMMPVLDGYETCRLLKANEEWRDIPIIFVTALTKLEDKVKGFDVGAVDYVTKPFQHEEVLARVNTHLNLACLRKELESKNRQLQAALNEIRQLSGIIPICSKCKKVRDDAGYWQQVENFLKTHTGVDFTHGYCPDCYEDEFSGLRDLPDGS
ncbi:MAG: response regulator [Proteobacteria bacterium]|nr:response regulator [Pseudomonadota bacterium]MBU1640854.1 response regulator [Pseudomonadota bacterium]